jgi:hypothetical protein
MDNAQIDQELRAALYLLGFNFLGGDVFRGEIAEIKGDMTIKLVNPPGEELKFVVELPGNKQMTFSVDRHQIVTLAEGWQWRAGIVRSRLPWPFVGLPDLSLLSRLVATAAEERLSAIFCPIFAADWASVIVVPYLAPSIQIRRKRYDVKLMLIRLNNAASKKWNSRFLVESVRNWQLWWPRECSHDDGICQLSP